MIYLVGRLVHSVNRVVYSIDGIEVHLVGRVGKYLVGRIGIYSVDKVKISRLKGHPLTTRNIIPAYLHSLKSDNYRLLYPFEDFFAPI